MKLINKINADPFQQAVIVTDDGTRVNFYLRYLPTQKMWMADFISDRAIRGINVVNSANLLRGYQNVISYGITCITDDGQDPRGLDDFRTGYARLYLLDADDVEQMEADIYD